MYNDYFGLNQAPFKITPDTSLFFPGGNRGAVLDALIYAITSGEGIVKVVGEVGSGKTMICRMLEVELPENIEIVYLANPSLSPDNILHAIAFELKLSLEANEERLKVMNKLQEYLLQRHAENHQVVVFVEEAQSMPIATLEEIRLLSNLETNQNKLLQIVLFGQPELDHMISNRDIRQLKERITYSFNLNPFKPSEIKDYLNSRLRACGYRAGDVFSKSAVNGIARYSNGLLRRINILADKAMLAAYASNMHNVKSKHVRIAARDSEFVAGWQRFRPAAVMISIALLIILSLWLLPFDQIKDRIKNYAEINTSVTITAPETVSFNTVYLPQDHSYFYEYFTMVDAPASSFAEISQAIYHQQDVTNYYEDFSEGELSYLLGVEEIDIGLHEYGSLQKVAGSDVKNTVKSEDIKSPAGVKEDMAGILPDKIYTPQVVELGGSLLTSEESDLLIQQLKHLPPEAINQAGDGAKCRVCASIIYRPVIKPENL